MSALLSAEELTTIDAWWRTANYLSVGQIYLLANPLLRHPLTAEHVKPRLLGHWGTTPGLNFVYVHMNRAIAARGISTIYVTGPGHGGPGLVAGAYLDGTYTEIYRHVGHDEEGLRRLFRQLATRSGSVDPGLLLWLLERCDLSERELADGLEHRSGLLGLGGSADMRDLLERADDAGADDAGADDARARGAIEVYLHRLRSGIGAMAAALGGVDALAFTGGVGENSPPIRAGALDGLGFLGLSVDPERNHDARLDARISPDGAGAAVVAVRAREDLEIARQVRELFA